FGLFCNLKFPKFQCETEVEVVKQSAACGLSILSFIAAIIPGILVAVIPAEFGSFVTLFFVLLILFITYLLYRGVLRAKF
ncbi:MAG: hypothetical protein J6Z22_06395, partial [Lachnospiraceae bacterium]|nr:hypothetical protein [Lachnospiraceae bacterium]